MAKGKKQASAIQLLGSQEKLSWAQDGDALVIQKPASWPCAHAVAFKIVE